MSSYAVTAYAKLNLYLHITGKRPDGYHLLDSLVVFTRFGDTIEVSASDTWSMEVTGLYAGHITADENNLAWRAGSLLAHEAGTRQAAHMRIDKRIPVAAGIGGGSSDAAATLRALCMLWNYDPDPQLLYKLALALGSDVPVCLSAKPTYMRGTGELLSDATLNFPSVGIVLVNPRIALSTRDVFHHFSGGFTLPSPIPTTLDLEWLYRQGNDLEPAAIAALPVITRMLLAIRRSAGCLLSRMSGSGATCFGIYEDEITAQRAAEQLTVEYPQWWVTATGLQRSEHETQ